MSAYSQQSCLSSQEKFLASTGLNIYNKGLVDTQLIGTGTTDTVTYPLVVAASDTRNYTFDGTEVTIEENGLYAIYADAILQDATDPVANDIDVGYFLRVEIPYGSGQIDYDLARGNYRRPARGATPGSDNGGITMNACLYLTEGTLVRVRITNFAPTNVNVMGTSTFQIQRIA